MTGSGLISYRDDMPRNDDSDGEFLGAGEFEESPAPLGGATMTIAAFTEARKSGPVVGTLFGRVTKGLRCLDGDALTVADFSGATDLWVPRSVPTRELGVGKWFEFDVVAEEEQFGNEDLAARRKAVTEAALNGDAQAAGALALDLIIAIQGSERPIVANAQRFVDRK